jgi:hypothetical protein
MGRALSVQSITPAEDTAAMLQQAALHRGPAVLIPGAFEMRPAHPLDSPPVAAQLAAARVPIHDRAERERKREGGGAPRSRVGQRYLTRLRTLWRCMRHPADLPLIWRDLLFHAR